MLHYKTVQQRFSAETMNSDEKIAEKEEKAAAASLPPPAIVQPRSTPSTGSVVVGGVEKEAVANGMVNGAASDAESKEEEEEDSTDEEERARRRKAKGKGKATAE
jgi:peroxin-6